MSADNSLLANKYQQKTDKEHILSNPDTYVGSVEHVSDMLWIFCEADGKIVQKNIEYIPGLFKLFDEGIVNCRDHVIRMQTAVERGDDNAMPVTHIDISISADDGTIVMTNDGNGIDVATHPEHNIWIPELIFGHLRTSTNYDKTEKKIIGGKNGFGFKLVLIWSTYGCIETVDHVRGLKYTQEFRDNLNTICKPKIIKCTKTKPYTKITFKPDYERFGIAGLSDDVVALLKKRVYDVAAITSKTLKVKFNSLTVPIKTFQQYIDLYIGDKSGAARVYEEASARWEYAVALSPNNEFMHISFVNGIYTMKGGKHVDYIIGQITRKLVDYIETKKKIKVQPNTIREQLILFVRSDIENPAFDSQTKDYMNTPVSKFGSTCTVSDKFIEKVAKLGVMETACSLTKTKESNTNKKTDGCRSKFIEGIPKLTQANWAGGAKSPMCTLIICEGDSAKSGIISGLTRDDRNAISVYPLKGKLLNVRGEDVSRIYKNNEILELRKIIGLKTDHVYSTIEDVHKQLNYGRVVFMTDQDLDGSHIKGLCINLFHNNWRSLTRLTGFLGFINTPILKARKGARTEQFYNEGEFIQWKEANHDGAGWAIKYYKGLGTSTKDEFIEYMKDKNVVGFKTSQASDDSIDMVFNKKRADDRKQWLKEFDRNVYLDTTKTEITYDDFINKELVHFSKYDCDRSIPHLIDGLKTSLRKILFSAFKRNLVSEIKVAQFAGYVSEHACYHHGEASLTQAITGMAQQFVGSNNMNILAPVGQFGSRIHGGKDSASPRYIFTRLCKITRILFNAADDEILDRLYDDGTPVEPRYYIPILPMILINGSEGIGTGFSTSIMCHNPLDIVSYIMKKIKGESTADARLFPYYHGYTGDIIPTSDSGVMFRGMYEKVNDDTICITELPVGYWTHSCNTHLDHLRSEGDTVKSFYDNSNADGVHFTVIFVPGKLAELEQVKLDHGCCGVHKILKLCTTKTTTNMHMFNQDDKLVKYGTATEIIDAYYDVRLHYYSIRKQALIKAIKRRLVVLENKVRYIMGVIDGTITLIGRKRDALCRVLTDMGFDEIDGDVEYKYLLRMPMDSVCDENVTKLTNECNILKTELTSTEGTSTSDMWMADLRQFELAYAEYVTERNESASAVENIDVASIASKKGASKPKKSGGGAKKVVKIAAK